MSPDQLRAAAPIPTPATAASAPARDPVVVPMRGRPGTGPVTGPGTGPGTRAAAPPGPRTVAQIADYLGRARPSQPPRGAADPAPRLADAHADELDRLLRQHIETHLDLMTAQAPELAQPAENIRRSVALLLKLRAR